MSSTNDTPEPGDLSRPARRTALYSADARLAAFTEVEDAQHRESRAARLTRLADVRAAVVLGPPPGPYGTWSTFVGACRTAATEAALGHAPVAPWRAEAPIATASAGR
ncbi:hypothetical protein [Patulibacter medicamentivorans]|uniref:hypothetical protein n=1 Tax=Patulibacter medicamentivorans TaxID=1097667 RepID=UPI00059079D3|nr:hypothetical protein [Patulibacter medicamentivorans]